MNENLSVILQNEFEKDRLSISATLVLILISVTWILPTHIPALKAQKLELSDNIYIGPSKDKFADSKYGKILKKNTKKNIQSHIMISNFADPKVRLRYKDSIAAIKTIEKDIGRKISGDDYVYYTRTSRHIHNLPAVSMMFRSVETKPITKLSLDTLDQSDAYIVSPIDVELNLDTNRIVTELDTHSNKVIVHKLTTLRYLPVEKRIYVYPVTKMGVESKIRLLITSDKQVEKVLAHQNNGALVELIFHKRPDLVNANPDKNPNSMYGFSQNFKDMQSNPLIKIEIIYKDGSSEMLDGPFK